MFVKRILIYFPLVLIIFLAQSFFWVPTYDKQAVGNPERLKSTSEVLLETQKFSTLSLAQTQLVVQ